jgi:hypothetical protein
MSRTRRPTKLKSRRNYRVQGSGSSSSFPYLLAAMLALALLAGAGYWMTRTAEEMAVDADTLCPTSTGPIAAVIILFDLTDPLVSAQSSQLVQYLEREFDDAAVGTQFTMGVVSEDPAEWGATAPLCKPRTEKDVSALTQNLTMVKERYEQRFRLPLEANIRSMISASGANSSPIMESLQALISDTPGFLTFTGPRRVIVVSDLLQNSDAMSFYRGDDWKSFSSSPEFARISRTLDSAEVTIFSVPREVEKIKDPTAVEDFWLRYFELQGARLPTLRSLGDL